ncbi:phage tail protein [Pseudomonas nitroreducens]|uniref:phage tail-collar fiber domain-containing protein n=1 Tax=Pseudomonas nitroreducens TaxID=46680 RepID=UPI0002D26FB9|nr:phage tail protein [Pseudomonas nitroreducens]
MAYKSIHTLKGLNALARAESLRVPINLTHMAVGDGNGKATAPKETDTGLVRERFRAAINRVYQTPSDSKRFTAELVIPASSGGWTLREVGVFDSNGTLFAVGNLPDTYKPTAAEGAFSDVVIRLDFTVSNADIVTVQVDPGVAMASQLWVTTNITAAQIIPGGTVTQILGKKSNADGDYEWKDLGEINVTVDTIAERQTLAAGQTTVDLSVTTTYGLAVYIEGLRKDRGSGADDWQPDAQLPTRLKLGKSYAAGSRITLVNNEPAGSAAAPLERMANLADVNDKAKARENLEIFSKAEAKQLAPAGLIASFARSTAPTGWLKANGAAISRAAYAELFAAIGTQYGAGDGFTTFNLPDLRGEIIRGWDDGRGLDGGRVFGSVQACAIQSHGHAADAASSGSHNHNGTANAGGSHNHAASSAGAGNHNHSAWTDTQGDHSHAAWADTQGNHQHASAGSPGIGQGSGGGNSVMQSLGSTSPTSVAGAHSHNIGIGGAGSHAHNVGIGIAGEHAHGVSVGSSGEHSHPLSITSNGTHTHTITITATGSAETRPRNLALLMCIKY